MKSKPTPQKPDRPVGSIVFSKTGKVHMAEEHLPRTTKPLEMAIADKFVGAMAHFHKISLENVIPAEAQDDFSCKQKDGTIVRVQIVEVVDQVKRKLAEQRRSYPPKLEASLARDNMFSGCLLTITDGGHEPTLPTLREGGNTDSLIELLAHIRGLPAEGLPVGKRLIHNCSVDPGTVQLSLCCERHQPRERGVPLRIRWMGGRLMVGDERDSLLAETIIDKVKRRYAKPPEEFWLLAYSRYILATTESPEVIKAVDLLRGTEHPFDQIWFLSPLPNLPLGHVVRLWPAGDSPRGTLLKKAWGIEFGQGDVVIA